MKAFNWKRAVKLPTRHKENAASMESIKAESERLKELPRPNSSPSPPERQGPTQKTPAVTYAPLARPAASVTTQSASRSRSPSPLTKASLESHDSLRRESAGSDSEDSVPSIRPLKRANTLWSLKSVETTVTEDSMPPTQEDVGPLVPSCEEGSRHTRPLIRTPTAPPSSRPVLGSSRAGQHINIQSLNSLSKPASKPDTKVMENTFEEDWPLERDPEKRRRVQNRIMQRKFRLKAREQIPHSQTGTELGLEESRDLPLRTSHPEPDVAGSQDDCAESREEPLLPTGLPRLDGYPSPKMSPVCESVQVAAMKEPDYTQCESDQDSEDFTPDAESTTDTCDWVLRNQFGISLQDLPSPRVANDVFVAVRACLEEISCVIRPPVSPDHPASAPIPSNELPLSGGTPAGGNRAPTGYSGQAGGGDNSRSGNRDGRGQKRANDDPSRQDRGSSGNGFPGDQDNEPNGGANAGAKRAKLVSLSCPYRKRNAVRFNIRDHLNCATSSFSDISGVKRHVKNCHSNHRGLASSEFACSRCKRVLPSKAALDRHLNVPKEQICEIVQDQTQPNRDPEDGISQQEEDILNARTSAAKVDDWHHLWKTLFPEDNVIPCPDFVAPVELDEVCHVFESTKCELQHRMEELIMQIWPQTGQNGLPVSEMTNTCISYIHGFFEQARGLSSGSIHLRPYRSRKTARLKEKAPERIFTARLSGPSTVPGLAPRANIPQVHGNRLVISTHHSGRSSVSSASIGTPSSNLGTSWDSSMLSVPSMGPKAPEAVLSDTWNVENPAELFQTVNFAQQSPGVPSEAMSSSPYFQDFANPPEPPVYISPTTPNPAQQEPQSWQVFEPRTYVGVLESRNQQVEECVSYMRPGVAFEQDSELGKWQSGASRLAPEPDEG